MHEHRRTSGNLTQDGEIASQYRESRGHRLDDGKPEALAVRREQQQRRPPIDRVQRAA